MYVHYSTHKTGTFQQNQLPQTGPLWPTRLYLGQLTNSLVIRTLWGSLALTEQPCFANHSQLIVWFTISTHLCGRIVETNGILFWSCGCGDKWSAQCYHKVGVNGAVCKQGITVHVQLHSQRNECTLVKIFDYSACEMGNQKIQDWSWDDLASRTHRTTKTSSNVVEAQHHTQSPPRLFFWVSLKLQVKSWDGKPG